jgi:hypothetical protein
MSAASPFGHAAFRFPLSKIRFPRSPWLFRFLDQHIVNDHIHVKIQGNREEGEPQSDNE